MFQIQPQPLEIRIKIQLEFQNQNQIIDFEMEIEPSVPFQTFRQYFHDQIKAKIRKFDPKTLYYALGQTEIKENENKSLAQLGFRNNSQLQIFDKYPHNKYKFRIITKLSTFKLELICHQDMNSTEFEQRLQKLIFEKSGLKANIDYVDQLVFQVRSNFSPFSQFQDHIEDIMLENTTFDIILEPINQAIH